MSLEQALQENTAALLALTAKLGGGVIIATTAKVADIGDAKKPEASPSIGTTKESKALSAPSDTGESAPVTFADLAAVGTKLLKADRQALEKIVDSYNARKLSGVPEDKWAEALAAINAALEAIQ
mgnify:CR=1 FL=1